MKYLALTLAALLYLFSPPPLLGGWGPQGCQSPSPVGGIDQTANAQPAFTAKYQTQNFSVDAPTAAFAAQIGEAAEASRKKWAVAWLGYEIQPWKTRCPIRVTISSGGAGGATTFSFDGAKGLVGMSMHVEGSADRILISVLPHEVTHTVLATYLQQPMPRWADEGGAVCSEDEGEKIRHDQLCRKILNTPGRAIPLARLFTLTEYPQDVMALYAQGYSVTEWLISLKNRHTFLMFVWHGMQRGRGWDEAVRVGYGYDSVNALEAAWLQHLRDTKKQPGGTGAPPITSPPKPSFPVASSSVSDDRVMTAIEGVNRKLDSLLTLKADVADLQRRTAQDELDIADLKRRLAIAEADLARQRGTPITSTTPSEGIIRDIPGWNQQRQAQPIRYAQPVAAPASSPYSQPYCPNGNCPNVPYR